jgi:subtilisin-like proprotein convertase family protein
MKKHLLLISFILFAFAISAQTFTNTAGGAITDNNQYCYFPITVSGLPSSIDAVSFGLEYVTININHPSDNQLRIKLQAPDGSIYFLSTFNGGTGANYTNTIFHDTSTVPVTSGVAPFTGIYKPENTIASFNNNQNPNNVWNLMVRDQTTGLIGNVVSWSLTFSNTPAGYINFSATNLPIVIINTNGVAIPNNPKIDGTMGIIYNGPGMMNHPTDSINDYNGKIGIEIRGASSSWYPQVPYGFETRDTSNVQADASILSMPAEHDWCLISNWNDKVFIRNTLAYHLSRKMGHYAPRTRLVEVLLNGTYEGVYVLSEKIKRDSNRVSIANLDSTENTGLNVTGGYILQNNLWGGGTDGWQLQYHPIDHPTFNTHLLYEYPKVLNITDTQKTYIQTFINDFETALYGPNFQDSATGYRKYIGMNSFIDYLIVNELSRNGDGFKKSQFYHKGKDSTGYISPLKAGPVWDFDWAWKDINECSIFAATDGSGWSYKVNDCGPDNNSTGWMVRMMDDTTFQNNFRCRWDNFRTSILSDSALYGYIDSMTVYLNAAQARHFQKWATLGYNNGTPEIEPDPGTYLGEVQAFKDWISRRLAWLDANIPGNPNCPSPPVVTVNVKTEENYFISMYPNPANETVKIQFAHGYKMPDIITITDITGKILMQEKANNGGNIINISALKNGIYFCKIADKNAVVRTEKLVVIH